MLRTVLVPLDSSPAAEAGLDWAADAAARAGSALRLLAVAHDGACVAAEEYLGGQEHRLATRGIPATSEVATGSVTNIILQRAAEVDLTVMTYGTKRWLIGGALDIVMRDGTRPLVIVRGGCDPPPVTEPVILVPLETSAYSRAVLGPVQAMAHALTARVVLCHVVSPVGPYLSIENMPSETAATMAKEMLGALAELSDAAAELRQAGIAVEMDARVGRPEEELPRFARECGATLIAMATRGHDRLSRVLGSVAYSVVQSVRIPCLLVRPEGEGSATAEASNRASA